VESSTNLIHWERQWTNRMTSAEVEVPGGSAASRRFLRAVLIPE
jgi:hypothetical protein